MNQFNQNGNVIRNHKLFKNFSVYILDKNWRMRGLSGHNDCLYSKSLQIRPLLGKFSEKTFPIKTNINVLRKKAITHAFKHSNVARRHYFCRFRIQSPNSSFSYLHNSYSSTVLQARNFQRDSWSNLWVVERYQCE